MSIHVEATPNPNAMKFTSDKMIFEGNNSISVMPGQTSEHDILNELMKLEGVDNVFGFQHFITVNKKMDVEWDELTGKVEEVITKYGY
ncbi:NifU N-terminal domain-containing protein [Gracilibacillus suaedae]|uniref:NifU N-terminal domain-containing protein n=1 Tax=Gracilibacillus suaedae TaxID=2820273 RepID=UPI000C247822|nr:NifU N-terminal domain-containing protein [Gracilibacillus suaedae]